MKAKNNSKDDAEMKCELTEALACVICETALKSNRSLGGGQGRTIVTMVTPQNRLEKAHVC